ncbi:MAG: hypothetical protein CMB41_01600 [Euryarchaeota archaeon]|nr:hypothetical protein [Euryarchaeota archaeon]|tara:strand:- start:335 stop:1285 length:951 start_codon:yes stop_codon:yes gene_type:complete
MRRLLLLMVAAALMLVPGAGAEEADACPEVEGTSTEDRVGCLDSDGDGYSNPDENWTLMDGADAFPDDPLSWSDGDGDGYPDQSGASKSDDCPFTYGTSRVILLGCSDIDRDFVPDIYDDDADGDGIRNEMERAASSGTILYDPFNPDSTPADTDQDTIPDVIDDDADGDGWPNDIENDRNADPMDPDVTPFTIYFGANTGVFYLGGFSFTNEYQPRALELSVSVVIEIVTEELVIPFLLIPIYILIGVFRRRTFRSFDARIHACKDLEALGALEAQINELIRNRAIRVHHGLVLRNAIELEEDRLRNLSTGEEEA